MPIILTMKTIRNVLSFFRSCFLTGAAGGFAVACLMLMSACERRPLEDPADVHYIRVYVDEELKNVTTGFYAEDRVRPEYVSPSAVRVVLYDPSTGEMVTERYLRESGRDEKGLYFHGHINAEQGEYNLLAYNFGTESTILADENHFFRSYAYTNAVSALIASRLPSRSSGDEPLVNMPDDLFLSKMENLEVLPNVNIDTLYNENGEHFRARSIVKSYYLQLRIRGVQYASEISSMLSGLGGSVHLAGPVPEDGNPVTIWFDCHHTEPVDNEAILYTTFSTFGKLPDETNMLKMSFAIVTTTGQMLVADIDITDEFLKPDAVEHQWILLDKVIELTGPEIGGGGGFSPGVNDWTDVSTDIII